MSADPTQEKRRQAKLQKTFILVGAILAGMLFALSPWGRHLDLLCYDTLFLLRGSRTASDQVVVVAVDEASFGVLEKKWPWPREWHARLVETLFSCGARSVAVDILFAEPGDPEDDAALERIVLDNPGTVLAAAVDVVDVARYRHQTLILPSDTVAGEESRAGIINLPLDSDGFIRRGMMDFGEMPSLFHGAFRAFSSDSVESGSAQGRMPSGKVMANYFGPPQTLKTVSYYQAMEPDRYLPEDFFSGKMVFIGLSLQTGPETGKYAADHFLYSFSRGGESAISGVEIQATLGANLLDENWICMLPGAIPISAVVWVFALALLVFLPLRKAILFTILLSGLTSCAIYGLFAHGDLYLPPVFALMPIVGGAFTSPFCEAMRLRSEKLRIRNMFSKYLSPRVVSRLIEDPKKLQPGGERVDATVLHLDIEGFSRMASDMRQEDLVAMLSRTLGHFTEIIFKNDGTVDKYVGDAIMAVWGVPAPRPDHAEKACRAALEVRRSLKTINDREKTTLGAVDIRIGISSGEMLAGNVGGEQFLNYTVHGEAANLAVRLEALNKKYDTRILMSGQTAARLGNEFMTREIDRIEIAGQSSPVTIHELIGFDGFNDGVQSKKKS